MNSVGASNLGGGLTDPSYKVDKLHDGNEEESTLLWDETAKFEFICVDDVLTWSWESPMVPTWMMSASLDKSILFKALSCLLKF